MIFNDSQTIALYFEYYTILNPYFTITLNHTDNFNVLFVNHYMQMIYV